MRRTFAIACLLLALGPGGACGGQDANGTAAPASEIGKLIEDLGDARFATRRQAFESLKGQGRAALGLLTEALEASDAEIRTRAADLLVQMRGRGFLGIQLQEDWGQDTPQDPDVEDEGVVVPDAGGGAEPAKPAKPGEPAFRPPPVVVAVSVLRGQNLPAEKAGLQDGDRILAVNGRAVHGTMDLMREVGLAGPRTTISIRVEREGKLQTLAATLTRNNQPGEPVPPVDLEAEDEKDPGGVESRTQPERRAPRVFPPIRIEIDD